MSEKLNQIIDLLKTLTLLEASELITKIEEIFNVDSSISSNSNQAVLSTPTIIEEVEEKTEFNLILEEFPSDKKIAILKIIRGLTGLGLKEAKELVESAPKQIQENVPKNSAEEAKKQLEDAGAKVTLK